MAETTVHSELEHGELVKLDVSGLPIAAMVSGIPTAAYIDTPLKHFRHFS